MYNTYEQFSSDILCELILFINGDDMQLVEIVVKGNKPLFLVYVYCYIARIYWT